MDCIKCRVSNGGRKTKDVEWMTSNRWHQMESGMEGVNGGRGMESGDEG